MPHNEFKAKGKKQPEITPEGQDQVENHFYWSRLQINCIS